MSREKVLVVLVGMPGTLSLRVETYPSRRRKVLSVGTAETRSIGCTSRQGLPSRPHTSLALLT